LDDRANWIHKFTVFVNPSYQEGLPTTVIEGLLSQCVVVATRVGGTSEISDQKDLVLVRPGEVQELADALRFAIDNYEHIS
jgi:glycosyltransferase involved in cell wall biosynthesis